MAKLTLILSDTGLSQNMIEAVKEKPQVSMRDIRAHELFRADPDTFFLYYNDSVITEIDSEKELLQKAKAYLSEHPDKSLTLAGHGDFGREKDFSDVSFEVSIRRIRHRLNITYDVSARSLITERGQTLLQAHHENGLLPGTNPTLYWKSWFSGFFLEKARLLAGVRSEAQFFRFLQEMAALTGTRMNWNALARKTGLARTTCMLWRDLLIEQNVIEVVRPQPCPAPRRNTHRDLMFFNSTSLALWLKPAEPDDVTRLKALTLNALYLAMRNARVARRFSHFYDTNHFSCPLLAEGDQRIGVYPVYGAQDAVSCARDALSMLRSSFIERALFLCTKEVYSEMQSVAKEVLREPYYLASSFGTLPKMI